MSNTQKIYLGDHLIEDIRYGNHKIITALGNNSFPVIDSSTVLYLDTTNSDSYNGTGATWYDLSSAGNDADVTNLSGSWDSNGYFDIGFSTYAGEGTVTHASSLDVFDGDFTVQIVGSMDDSAGAPNDLCGMFGKTRFTSNPGIGHLFVRNPSDGNYKKTVLYVNNTSIGVSSVAFTNLGDFFVIQYVRSGSTINYYANNTSIHSGTNSSNGNNTLNFVIGTANTTSDAYRWAGKIVNIGIYDKALSSAEREQNLNYYKNELGF